MDADIKNILTRPCLVGNLSPDFIRKKKFTDGPGDISGLRIWKVSAENGKEDAEHKRTGRIPGPFCANHQEPVLCRKIPHPCQENRKAGQVRQKDRGQISGFPC